MKLDIIAVITALIAFAQLISAWFSQRKTYLFKYPFLEYETYSLEKNQKRFCCAWKVALLLSTALMFVVEYVWVLGKGNKTVAIVVSVVATLAIIVKDVNHNYTINRKRIHDYIVKQNNDGVENDLEWLFIILVAIVLIAYRLVVRFAKWGYLLSFCIVLLVCFEVVFCVTRFYSECYELYFASPASIDKVTMCDGRVYRNINYFVELNNSICIEDDNKRIYLIKNNVVSIEKTIEDKSLYDYLKLLMEKKKDCKNI